MFCPYCGFQNDEENNFCLNCGRLLPGKTIPSQKHKPEKKNFPLFISRIFILILFFFCSIAAGLLVRTLYLYLTQNSKEINQNDIASIEPEETQQEVTSTYFVEKATSTEEIITFLDNAIFKDDFSDINSGWEIGTFEAGEIGYKDGIYFVTSTERDAMMWGAAQHSLSNVIIDVDAVQISAPSNNNNDYGVMCRVQYNGDGYSFNISGDGFYSIQRASDDSFVDLVTWQEASVIHQGNNVTNHIRAVCDGEKLVLFANGELLAEITDTYFTEGDIALTATTYETDMTEIHFDNIVVRPSQ